MDEYREKKMTLDEYKDKYSKPQHEAAAKAFLFVFAAGIGVIIFFCLFSIVTKVYEMNVYAGYAAIAISVLVFIFAYIVPLVKITSLKAFKTNVNFRTAREAKRYNESLREEIATRMIEVNEKTEGVTWYSEKKVNELALAQKNNQVKALKQILTKIYDEDVKEAANKMIRDHALKVGLTTALSQSEKIDTLFSAVYDLNLIKDIIYLYGYRPNNVELAIIYKTVITNALVAYGANSFTSSLAQGIIGKISSVTDKVPFLNVVGTVIDSVLQGMINATLTVTIGFETKRFLKKEYHLQDILDEIDLSEEAEEANEEAVLKDVTNTIKQTAKVK